MTHWDTLKNYVFLNILWTYNQVPVNHSNYLLCNFSIPILLITFLEWYFKFLVKIIIVLLFYFPVSWPNYMILYIYNVSSYSLSSVQLFFLCLMYISLFYGHLNSISALCHKTYFVGNPVKTQAKFCIHTDYLRTVIPNLWKIGFLFQWLKYQDYLIIWDWTEKDVL